MRPAPKTKNLPMKTTSVRLVGNHFAAALVSALIPLLAAAGPSHSAQGTGRAAETQSRSLELSRPVRPWEFLPVVGTRAGLFGNESGRMEAWVYPLKLLRDFHLQFHVDGRGVPAESLARAVVVRPESSTIVFSGDTFTVSETFFAPVGEPGAVIAI